MDQLMITPKEFLGKELEDAVKLAESKGFKTRIIEQDGKSIPYGMDVRSDRVNFRVMNNKIIDVVGG